MIEADLLELLESEVTLRPPGQRRRDGHALSWGAAITPAAHIETRTRKMTNAAGDEVVSVGRALLDSAYEDVTEAWQLTLPDGRTPQLVAIETTYGPNEDTGENGPYQTVVYWGTS